MIDGSWAYRSGGIFGDHRFLTSTYGIYGYQTNGFSGNANYYVYLNNSTFTGTAVYSYGLVEVPLQTRLLDQNTAFGGYNLIGSL